MTMTDETLDPVVDPVVDPVQDPTPAAVDAFDDVRQRLAALFPGERLVVWRDADGGLHYENQGF